MDPASFVGLDVVMRPEMDLLFSLEAFQPIYMNHLVIQLQLGEDQARVGKLVVSSVLVFLLDTLLFYSKLGRSLVINVCIPANHLDFIKCVF